MRILYILLITIVLYFNVKIYFGPDLSNQKDVFKSSLNQLNYLENGLKNENFDSKSQEIFPEGYIFINALYGLSWCEVAKKQNPNSALFKKGLKEAKYAYHQLKSQKAKSTFPKFLLIKYGAFYMSWTNYLLGKIISLERSPNSQESLDFIKNCEEINSSFKKNDFELLESYTDQVWPADNMGMLASLKIYDKIFERKYTNTVDKIIKKLKDKNYELFIPHSMGKVENYPRGSSASLMLIFLPEIDSEYALKVFENYKIEFITYKLGQAGIREFPKNINEQGDIDSGPILFGIGSSGTIVSVGTFLKFNELKIANKISNEVETLGFPITFQNKKKYLWGSLPIADAFIVWSRLQSPITSLKETEIYPESNIQFHTISLIVSGILIFLIFKRNQKKTL